MDAFTQKSYWRFRITASQSVQRLCSGVVSAYGAQFACPDQASSSALTWELSIPSNEVAPQEGCPMSTQHAYQHAYGTPEGHLARISPIFGTEPSSEVRPAIFPNSQPHTASGSVHIP